MSDLFRPIDVGQLAHWLFSELETRDAAFGIPRQYFFRPQPTAAYRTRVFGQALDTPSLRPGCVVGATWNSRPYKPSTN
jgi:hypothetical protein